MDWLVRLIEGIVQWIISFIQPLLESGTLGYLMPLLLLIGATIMAATSKNRINLAGYVLGWVISFALIGIYLEGHGDNILINLTGQPRGEFLLPLLIGFLIGFVALTPFIRIKLVDAAPIIITLVTATAITLLFLAYRAGASFTVPITPDITDIIEYRRRYIGLLSLAFGAGVLLHVVVSASNPPKPPPAPPKKD